MHVSAQAKADASPNRFVRILSRLMSWFAKVEVAGVDNLNRPGGKVVVCNHVGWADPIWFGYAVLPRRLHQMAKKELFDNPVSAQLVRSCGGFPVERSRPSAATIKHVISLVEREELLLIFPLGKLKQRSPEAKRGAATIAVHANAKILPAHYNWTESIRMQHLRCRPTIRITFGYPLPFEPKVLSERQIAMELTQRLDRAMEELAQDGQPRE